MSSHHVVREKQEPALLILGLDNFSEELLGQLLEWSPTVIVTPYTADKVHTLGIKMDWVITDKTSLYLQSDIKLIAPGNDSDTEAAIKQLITYGYTAVNVITSHVSLKDYLFYVDKINIVIYSGNRKIYAVNSGFSKWKQANENVELVSLANGLKTVGLKEAGNRRYQTVRDGFFSLRFKQPFLFIAEEI